MSARAAEHTGSNARAKPKFCQDFMCASGTPSKEPSFPFLYGPSSHFATLLGGPRVELVVNAPQTGARNLRVDLRGGDVRVPEHHLEGPQIGAVLEQVRRERVAQTMGCQPGPDARL